MPTIIIAIVAMIAMTPFAQSQIYFGEGHERGEHHGYSHGHHRGEWPYFHRERWPHRHHHWEGEERE